MPVAVPEQPRVQVQDRVSAAPAPAPEESVRIPVRRLLAALSTPRVARWGLVSIFLLAFVLAPTQTAVGAFLRAFANAIFP